MSSQPMVGGNDMGSYYEKSRPDSIDKVIDMNSEMKESLCHAKRELAETDSEKLLHGQYGGGKTLRAEILVQQRGGQDIIC